jgi:hypothetical protein
LMLTGEQRVHHPGRQRLKALSKRQCFRHA